MHELLKGALGNALNGRLVVDFGQGIAGPYCGMLLAELGARVIKIEPPAGDWSRQLGQQNGGAGVAYKCFNRGKEGIVLDLKEKGDLVLARQLIDRADVLIESNRPGVMKRLGLSYDDVRSSNPGIAYVSVSGFGQEGPDADRPATDILLQAMTGMTRGFSEDDRPVRLRVALVDVVTGIYGAVAALGCLLQRDKSGVGLHLDISLMHSAAALQQYKYAEAAAGAGNPIPKEMYAGVGIFETADGYIAISVMRDAPLRKLLGVLGCPDLLKNPRFETSETRLQHEDEFRAEISRHFRKRSADDLSAALQAEGVLCQKILNYDEFMGTQQSRHMQLFQSVAFDGGGSLPLMHSPGHTTQSAMKQGAPRLGQDTEKVRQEAASWMQSANAHF